MLYFKWAAVEYVWNLSHRFYLKILSSIWFFFRATHVWENIATKLKIFRKIRTVDTLLENGYG